MARRSKYTLMVERLLYALKTKISKIIRAKSPASLARGKWRQEGQLFMVTVAYTLTLGPVWAIQQSISKKKKIQEADFSIYKVIISY